MNGLEQTLALTIAGALGVPILQVLKRVLNLHDKPMVWFTFFVSIVIAVLTGLLLGKVTLSSLLSDPMEIFGSGGFVMAIATVVYRTLKDKFELS